MKLSMTGQENVTFNRGDHMGRLDCILLITWAGLTVYY